MIRAMIGIALYVAVLAYVATLPLQHAVSSLP